MVSEKIVVGSALGIHLRPAGAMCDAAVKYDSHITFAYGEGKTADAKSVISILAAGIKCGDARSCERNLLQTGRCGDLRF